MHVVRWSDAASFRARAAAWLGRAEAEHNLLLGLIDQLEEDASSYEPPVYLATVEEGDEVIGCAFRTPPFMLGLTRMPPGAADAVARDATDLYESLPGVLGPEGSATEFAERWAELRGVRPRAGKRQRIHATDRVADLARRPAGAMRQAMVADLPVVGRWVDAFVAEAELSRPPARLAVSLLEKGGFWIWEDEGRPVSLAAAPARTDRWARIGYVYTPPEHRGCGFATALVSELTALMLAQGRRSAVLYTNLANPTSNAIYQRIGYRPVVDVIDILLGPSAGG